MKYTFRENPFDKTGVISNLHVFLNRNLDTGFKSKWSGFWVPPYKYLDYYALKVNGLWLDGSSLEGSEYGEDAMRFYFETDSLSITEEVRITEEEAALKVNLKFSNNTGDPKALHTSLEVGVDIRGKSQDLGPEKYDVERNQDSVKVGKDERELEITANEEMEFDGDSYIKDHHPDEHQRCLVPGTVDFMHELEPGEERIIEIEFSVNETVSGSLDRKEQGLEDHHLSHAFNESISSMLNLVYDRNGTGIIAGHPWFQTYWARDTFWTALGLVDAGYFELSEEILENFVDHELSGRIGLAGEDYSDFARSDTYPLFIIAADKLDRHYGASDKIEQGMEKAMEELDVEDGVVQHPGEGTWMDTLERAPAVDVQSLWLEAAKIMDENAEELELGLEEFKQEKYMKDYLSEESPRTINPTVPMMLGQLDEEEGRKYLSKVNAEFSSRYGARTRSMADPGYEAHGYHTGSVWGLTTGWAAAANLEYGKAGQGVNLLEKMAEHLDRDQPGALPEVVNAETGELMGCPEQAWSAGMMVHVIDTYLLGIRVEGEKIVVDPAMDVSCERRGKRLFDEKLDLRFEEGEVEVLNDPDLEVEIR